MQDAQDVVLHAEVEDDDLAASWRRAIAGVTVRTARAHPRYEICGAVAGSVAQPLQRVLCRLVGRHGAHHDAAGAELAGQRACIHAGDPRYAVLLQVMSQRALRFPVARRRAVLTDDERAHLYAARLDVVLVDAVVPLERV